MPRRFARPERCSSLLEDSRYQRNLAASFATSPEYLSRSKLQPSSRPSGLELGATVELHSSGEWLSRSWRIQAKTTPLSPVDF